MGIVHGSQERQDKNPPAHCLSQMVLPTWNRAQRAEGHPGAQVPLLQGATLLLSLGSCSSTTKTNRQFICTNLVQSSKFPHLIEEFTGKKLFLSFRNLNSGSARKLLPKHRVLRAHLPCYICVSVPIIKKKNHNEPLNKLFLMLTETINNYYLLHK